MATLKGGDKFQAKMAELAKKLNRPETLKVGFLDNGKVDENGISDVMKAVYNEYGTPDARFPIPPRPFFRTMIANKSPQWPDVLAAKLKEDDYNINSTLTAMGELISGQLQDSILNGGWLPNSEATLAGMFGHKKKGTQPLVDTGDMLNAVAFEIKS
jgi:hypothetical protein